MTQAQTISATVIVTFGLTMMLGPLAIDTYLPAFPLLATALAVDMQDISLSISVYLAGFAVGQLSGGALSDQFGRRRVLLGGLAIFVATSFWLATVDSLQALLWGRLLQSLGGGWVGVSVPALIRDRVWGTQAAKLFSVMGMVVLVAPAIAPAVGAALLSVGSWRLIFVALGLYALLLIPLLWLTVFRGQTPAPPVGAGTGVVQRYLEVLRTRPARPYIGWQAAAFAGLLLFVTYASYIYQQHYGQSRSAFTLLFAGHIGAMFCGNIINRLLLNHYDPQRIMRTATLVQVIAAALLLLVALTDWPVYAFLAAIMLYAGSLSAISPNLHACYLEHFPRSSASAAAVMGTAQFGLGGLAGGASTLLPESLLSVTACIGVAAVVSLGFMLYASRRTNGSAS